MKKRLFCLVNLLLALCIAVSIAACSSGGGFNITVEGDYGRITERRQADAGEKIFVRSALEGYDLAEVYLNGSKLEGDSFIMPQEDVVLTYRLSATGKDVHSIVMQPSDGGEVVCDLLSASSGDTVYLRSVPFYNSKLSYYTVNGEKCRTKRSAFRRCLRGRLRIRTSCWKQRRIIKKPNRIGTQVIMKAAYRWRCRGR